MDMKQSQKGSPVIDQQPDRIGFGIGLSAIVNPMLGRRVHWDWAVVMGVSLFVALALALQRRWL